MPVNKQCPKCFKVFTTKQRLDRHLAIKSDCSINRKTCPHCQSTFANRRNLDYHIDHMVCLKTVDSLVKRETTNNNDQTVDKDTVKLKIELAKIELEKTQTLLKIKELETQEKQSGSININNAENVTINYITFGNEKTDPLSRDVIVQIANNPQEGYTGYGIKQLYFNPQCPENHIVQAKNPNARKVKYYNGTQWVSDDKTAVATKLLDGLVSTKEKCYKLIPAGDRDVDQAHQKHHEYKIDHIEETENRPHLVAKVENNMFKYYNELKSSP